MSYAYYHVNHYTLGEHVFDEMYTLNNFGEPTGAIISNKLPLDDMDKCRIHGGEFYGGEFHGGVFHGGQFYGGHYSAGEFFDGEYYGGWFMRPFIIHNNVSPTHPTYFNGSFISGEFWGGDFYGGTITDGTAQSQLQSQYSDHSMQEAYGNSDSHTLIVTPVLNHQ